MGTPSLSRRVRPGVEYLEDRRLMSATVVNQELHRPPTAVADINRDGLADLIVGTARTTGGGGGGGAGGIVGFDVYLNDGKGAMQFLSHTDCDDNDPALAFDVAAGDLNSDGYGDVVLKLFSVTGQPTPVGEASNEQIKGVIFMGSDKGGFEQQKAFTFPHVLETSGKSTRGFVLPHVLEKSGLAIADLDGDRVPDIISWNDTDVAAFLRGPRQTISLDGSYFNPKEYTRIFGVGDLDGDSRADLVFGEGSDLKYVSFDFKSGGAPTARVNKIEAITIKQSTVVLIGDLDGDRFNDDLVIMDGNSVAIGINDTSRGGGIKITNFDGKLGAKPEDVLIGDLDGDGRDDVFDIVARKLPPPVSKDRKEYVGHVTLLK